MNGESDNRESTIFNDARRLPPELRAAFLNAACASDPELRARIEELLRAAEAAEGFLDSPAPGLEKPAQGPGGPHGTVAIHFPSEKPGDQIGRYKLLQQIGEGGCGVVYMAEQEEPVRRRVALKVIKLGMDTKEVIARFEAERQALAMMDHPNIAKVLDAGTTSTGRPYFVMELVRGIKLTDYCDQNSLSTKQRLGLFTQVCRAVQHAHQKGIIHRDIKPSNILVTLLDGVPAPKVIDFGIAKAIEGRLTNKTVFTAFEQFIGTPAYMSPEQAEMSGLDIDTRSDVYSLGVLLYELLTGKTPFDAEELLRHGLDAMRRLVREKDPSRPSTRLSTMAVDELTLAARRRQTEPPKLVHNIRGDLDWIVMKCLEKDRVRRYDTATGLALDIERHLNNEAVSASPPSAAYRLAKFTRRHRGGVIAGGIVLLVLIAGTIGTTWGLVVALREKREVERQSAISEKTSEFFTGMFESVDPSAAKLHDVTVKEALAGAVAKLATAFPDQPLTELPIRADLASVYSRLGLNDEAITNARIAVRLATQAHVNTNNTDVLQSLCALAICLQNAGQVDDAWPSARAARIMGESLFHGDNTNLADAYRREGETLWALARADEALPPLESSFAMWKRLKGENDDAAMVLRDEALCLDQLGRPVDALPKHEQALAMWQHLYSGDDPSTANMLADVAQTLTRLGRPAEALPKLKDALSMQQRIYKGDHADVYFAFINVGTCLYTLGRYDEALTNYQASLEMCRRMYKTDNPDLAFSMNTAALCLDALGRPAEALPLYQSGAAMYQRLFSGDSPAGARALENLGLCLYHLGRPAEALTNCGQSLAMLQRLFPQGYVRTPLVMNNISGCEAALGKPDDALATSHKSEAMLRTLIARQPKDTVLSVVLAKTIRSIGDLLATSDSAGARTNYQQALSIVEAALSANPTDEDAQRVRLSLRAKVGLESVNVVVKNIPSDSQAWQFGVRPGDVVREFAGQPVVSASDLAALLYRPYSAPVQLKILRGGVPMEFTVAQGPIYLPCRDESATNRAAH